MSPGVPDRVKLRRVPLRSGLNPAQVLALIRDRAWPFLLIGTWAGGGAILGSEPRLLAGPDDDPFELWGHLPDLDGEPAEGAVGGGWFGWLGYGAGARIETLPPQPPRPVPLPEAHLAFYDNVLRLDPTGRWWFEALVTPEREAALDLRLRELGELLAADPKSVGVPEPSSPGGFRPVAPGVAGHLAAVARCRERIRSGELFQANLRLRLAAEMERGEDLAALFTAAAERIAPAYGALFLASWGGVASLSPELFLRRSGDLVETGPIKGTVRRPDDAAAAEAARRRLAHSAKDAAEHVMIVDVARNDLGRVCVPGTVTAPSAPTAEPHPGLWHLVSRVRGRLRPDAGDSELLRATFPPCSVTGAPKIQAMHAIAGLETLGREVFTGAIGFSSPAAGLEMNVAIRTFEARDGRIWIDVGGGIVADSDPERELEECLNKARPLIEAIGGELGSAGAPDEVASVTGAPWALDGDAGRPDPAGGLIETIAVRNGRTERTDRHLARLGRSLDHLYGIRLAEDLDGWLVAAAFELGEGALRVKVNPAGRVEIATRPIGPRTLPVPLRPFLLPGGLGRHKWADRQLADALHRDGVTPLLVDLDGAVLEAAWGNVWIEEGGRLLTPPADGRILPGVTRGAVLAAGEWEGMPVAAEAFDLERLLDAPRILLSSSLAGLVPASFPGGRGVPSQESFR